MSFQTSSVNYDIPHQGHRSNTSNEHCCKQSSILTSMYEVLQEICALQQKYKEDKIIEESCKDIENNSKFRNLLRKR